MSDTRIYAGQSWVPEFKLWVDSRPKNIANASLTVTVTPPGSSATVSAVTITDAPNGVMELTTALIATAGVWRFRINGVDGSGVLISHPAPSELVYP